MHGIELKLPRRCSKQINCLNIRINYPNKYSFIVLYILFLDYFVSEIKNRFVECNHKVIFYLQYLIHTF